MVKTIFIQDKLPTEVRPVRSKEEKFQSSETVWEN